jgi:hypothetical protein
MREAKVIVDLTPLHGSQVEIESFQVENQIVWNVLQTSSVSSKYLQQPFVTKFRAYRFTALT